MRRFDLVEPKSLQEACGLPSPVNGKPVSSYLMPGSNAEGKQVTTIEGRSRQGDFYAVQRAFLEHRAFQCNYFPRPALFFQIKTFRSRSSSHRRPRARLTFRRMLLRPLSKNLRDGAGISNIIVCKT